MAAKKKTSDSIKSKVSGYKLNPGDRAPRFRAAATGGAEFGSARLAGHTTVIYFYPRDNTPGCTTEGLDFRRLAPAFKKAGATIFGASGDSMKSHDSFKQKCGFPFELLSDPDGEMARAFDVIQTKSMYGREFQGIERSTFVIDPAGVVQGVWRKVKVTGHAEEVLAFVKGLDAK